MSDLLALLHTNSPLSLIHRYLDIQTIDSTQILEKLQKTSVDIDDDNEKETPSIPKARQKRRSFINKLVSDDKVEYSTFIISKEY
jgi:hypothetical protein